MNRTMRIYKLKAAMASLHLILKSAKVNLISISHLQANRVKFDFDITLQRTSSSPLQKSLPKYEQHHRLYTFLLNLELQFAIIRSVPNITKTAIVRPVKL